MAYAEVDDGVLHPILGGESPPGYLSQHPLGLEGVEHAVVPLENLYLVHVEVQCGDLVDVKRYLVFSTHAKRSDRDPRRRDEVGDRDVLESSSSSTSASLILSPPTSTPLLPRRYRG